MELSSTSIATFRFGRTRASVVGSCDCMTIHIKAKLHEWRGRCDVRVLLMLIREPPVYSWSSSSERWESQMLAWSHFGSGGSWYIEGGETIGIEGEVWIGGRLRSWVGVGGLNCKFRKILNSQYHKAYFYHILFASWIIHYLHLLFLLISLPFCYKLSLYITLRFDALSTNSTTKTWWTQHEVSTIEKMVENSVNTDMVNFMMTMTSRMWW